jgi:N-glycosylase/DNA lyase
MRRDVPDVIFARFFGSSELQEIYLEYEECLERERTARVVILLELEH